MNNHYERKIINTTQAPAAIGTYSQAVKAGDTVFFSGQIPLDPETGLLVDKDFKGQLFQVFDNLNAVAIAAGGTLDDIVKLTIYLTDLQMFPFVNEVMARCFNEPYPARAVIGVASLPKNAQVEADGVMILHQRRV